MRKRINKKIEEMKKIIKSEDDNQSVSFIGRVASILKYLSEGKNTVTEIARLCNFNTSTTHRLLNILKEPGFTMYDAIRHRYYWGLSLPSLFPTPTPLTSSSLCLPTMK